MKKVIYLVLVAVITLAVIFIFKSPNKEVLGTDENTTSKSVTSSIEFTGISETSYENSLFSQNPLPEFSAEEISQNDGVNKDCLFGYQDYVYKEDPITDLSLCGKLFESPQINVSGYEVKGIIKKFQLD